MSWHENIFLSDQDYILIVPNNNERPLKVVFDPPEYEITTSENGMEVTLSRKIDGLEKEEIIKQLKESGKL